MSLFDKFLKNPKRKEKAMNDDIISEDGWKAIENEFLRVYPGQTNPKHYAPLLKWELGGNDPLDGVSVYEAADYWHFVTFGLSELYEKEFDDEDISGYGYEMTFKLKKSSYSDLEGEIRCICGILQAMARITFTQGEVFGPNEFIYTGQKVGIDANQKSNITGFICIADPTVHGIDTPNGRVDFLELIGMTDAELSQLDSEDSVKAMYEKLGSDVTSYDRGSLVS